MRPVAAQTQAALWASRVLGRYHYKAVPLDDAMSVKIFDNYFDGLDGEKLYFVQADIDKFASLRTRMDDAINNEDLTGPFAIYNLFQQRYIERMNYARELLKTRPDFTLDEFSDQVVFAAAALFLGRDALGQNKPSAAAIDFNDL